MKPKVNFTIGKVEDYISIIKHFINSGWEGQIYSIYPDLKERLQNTSNKDLEIKKFFKNQEKKFAPIIEKVQKDFQNSWNKLNNDLMIALEDINEIKWDEKFNDFTARITLNPICPRYLEHNAFDVYFGLADVTMKTIVLHEISHFIFFEKFNKIFPNIDKEEFEHPHLVWKLSEAVPEILLKDKRIADIFEVQDDAVCYESIRKLEIGKERITDTLNKFYNDREDFEDFVKKSFEFFKTNEKEINEAW